MATGDPEVLNEGEVVREPRGSALAEIVRGEIDVQIATAKKYPRSITRFKRQTEQLACLDEDTAASMFYCIPRDGKTIEGPSVRFAEIIGSTWGNLRYGARIVDTDDTFITAQGACHDLETNNAVSIEVKRRITNKYGKRYSDDMIQVTGNAACSIALRQAIFKVVPLALAKDIYEKARRTAVGDATSMSTTRQKAIEWFTKAGATQERVLLFLGRESIDDVTMDDVIKLRGMTTAIRDGEITIEEALSVEVPETRTKAKAKPLDESVGKTPTTEPPAIAQARADFAKCETTGDVTRLHGEIVSDPSMREYEAAVTAMAVARKQQIAANEAAEALRNGT